MWMPSKNHIFKPMRAVENLTKHKVSFSVLCFFLSFLQSFEQQAFSQTEVLSNRSLVLVGGTSYSAWDSLFLLCSSNKVFEKPVKIEGRWILSEKVPALRKETAWAAMSKKPDLERFLFLVFTIEESQKLNLFVPSSEEIKKSTEAIRRGILDCPWEMVSAHAKDFYQKMSNENYEKWADKILRSKAFEQVRGGFDKNPNLIGQNWTWLAPLSKD
jgi:hypothetical protein